MLRVKRFPVFQQTLDRPILYKMLESLSTEIKVPFAVKMSSDIPSISKYTISVNSYKNLIQSPVIPVTPKEVPNITLVRTTNGDIR
ncbi:unnamed protein product [Hymenolepis diminuta]|uniref:Uncharacterized protein n=1 Tax=Hymenolepis diminuta TaxID=6216 RepID=A0A564Y8T1_HYMDI|nr:unnamed protein product [Hymenolepis diminuta]